MNARVILITGASSGIGYASALRFAARGDHVVGTARRVERLEQLAQEINAMPAGQGEFLPLMMDVQSAESVQAGVKAALERFGRIDVLVANAGVGMRGGVVEAQWDDVEKLLQTNIDGVLHSIRAVVPAMRQQGGGKILILSSVAYNLVSPYAALYAASKAFISSLSRSLRLELAQDSIGVTDLLVGRVETEFNEKRLGKAGRGGSFPPAMPVEKVAQAVVDASLKNRKSITLRWIDRLVILGNLLVPDLIGRKALKQYR